jgi:pimeloyl-ACP methyl ester carboxylesterase
MENTIVTIEVRGRKVHEAVGGAGKPLLYLHSAMGEAHWLVPHLPELAKRREVHAPAHPGFLASEGIEQIRDMSDYVDHYLDYLDVKGWEKVDVVGHSLGGWLAAEIAVREPERVGRLVLSSAVGIWIREEPLADIFAFNPDRPEKMTELLFHDTSSPIAQAMSPAIDEEMPEPLLVEFLKAMAATAKVGWNPLLHDPRLEGKLRRITSPTLCLWGDHDRVSPPAYARRYAERIAGARVELLPGCGHMSFLEKPVEWSQKVLAFVG